MHRCLGGRALGSAWMRAMNKPSADSAAGEGMALLQAGKLRDAELRFRQALSTDARDVQALIGLGIVAHQTGHFAPAVEMFDRALAVDPRQPAAHVNRGNALAAQHRFSEAVDAFRAALAVSPGLPSAEVNLAGALHALGRLDDAVATLEQARAAQPDSPELINNLGNLYKDQGRLDESLACYDRALQLNPMMQQAFSNRLSALKVDTRISAAQLLDEHIRWSDWFEAASTSAPLLTNPAEPARPLRIGYVSPDCHSAVPAFLDPVIAAHDRSQFTVYCYFNQPQPPARLARLGEATHRVMRGLDDAQVAAQVHEDRIDILIDIAGHTGHNRLGVFARKPAPVQITWLDYLCTTGLAAMDYRLTDATADPVGNERQHRERLLRLPHAQWCWQPDPQSPPVTAQPAANSGTVTFGSFNHAQKLTDGTLSLWRQLLQALPVARLHIGGIAEGVARQRVRAALACDEARLSFLPRVDVTTYRQSFAAVDIAFDPLPFSGATTTLDALWQGVPVLTLPGERSCSRSTASLLTALQLQDWIATDAADFVARAQRLSADRSALSALRQTLRARVQASVLCDVAGFTRDLEQRYRQGWTAWCAARHAANGDPAQLAGSDEALLQARAAIDAGRNDDALAILKPLLALRPQWEIAKRDLARAALAWARQHPEALPAWSAPVSPAPLRQRVSAIVCSIRPDYFNAIKARLSAQFAGHDFELIGIHDAKSLCEGYNRGAAQAGGDILIFCHDDIDIVHDDFGARLLHHLAANDVVGVVGTSKLVGGDWGYAGAPHVHGQVIHRPPGEAGYLYLAVGLQRPVTAPIQALDGVFIATHRRVWQALRFDQDTFDGFHLYDIDFTYRAFRAGYRLAVPPDLLLLHFSTGRYDLKWQVFHARFLDKFTGLSQRPSAARYANLHVKLQSLEQVERLHAGLFHHNFGASTLAITTQ